MTGIAMISNVYQEGSNGESKGNRKGGKDDEDREGGHWCGEGRNKGSDDSDSYATTATLVVMDQGGPKRREAEWRE